MTHRPAQILVECQDEEFLRRGCVFSRRLPGMLMRFLLRKNLINIVPANLMRLFILLPWMLIFCKKLHKGALEGYPPEA